MDTPLFLLFVVAGFYLWWRFRAIKEIALQAGRRYCKEYDLQLLDGSVWLRALWYKRDESGRIKLWRKFVFEFTATGAERHRGQIIMLGNMIEFVDLEPYQIH